MLLPPPLNKHSIVGLIAPSRKVDKAEIEYAVNWIKSRGYDVVCDDRVFAEHHQFAGDDMLRASLVQDYINSDNIDVLWFVRGGYGALRIIDLVDFTPLLERPKWVVGYSDATAFHGRLQYLGLASLHAAMPMGFDNVSEIARDLLVSSLEGEALCYSLEPHTMNRVGVASGEVVGGNLSVLYSLLGSDAFPSTDGKILFLEDLDEYIYHIDRMVMALRRAGKLNNLAGLMVGGMTEMHDNKVPFGASVESVIRSHVEDYDYPVCMNFPAGHFPDNRPIVMGKQASISVSTGEVIFNQ